MSDHTKPCRIFEGAAAHERCPEGTRVWLLMASELNNVYFIEPTGLPEGAFCFASQEEAQAFIASEIPNGFPMEVGLGKMDIAQIYKLIGFVYYPCLVDGAWSYDVLKP